MATKFDTKQAITPLV